ncbi:transcription factor MYC2 [Vigna unguiculata]|uniref:Transcription factor MYC2 n=1 Tax=Vigna unguiculata TaxID=3917 RepID=A0A4D6KIW4_VIGUN|nr:transcription factor MYC2 [Vigna unguiculata]
MEYEDEDWLCVTMEEFSLATENGSSKQGMGRKRNYDDETREFKSKNLETERRRREKLSSRLLMLRAIMNKATIIEDAITYIEKLQDKVQSLSQELHQIEATSEETAETKIDEIDAAQDMKDLGIQEEVRVAQIDGNKLWVKIIIEKRKGRFRKLMEALNNFSIELIDTNLTTTKGAFLITSCIQIKTHPPPPQMEYEDEDWLCVTMEEFSLATENGSSKQGMGRKRNYDDETREFKSKNLETERRRREKLSSRLLMLPTIIEDAITYIEKLQDKVQSLSQELHQIEATSEETAETKIDEIDAAQDMKDLGIQEEVRVAQIDGNKLWVKIIIEKRKGRFRKLMEALNNFSIELIDTNLTTTKGAFLITSCIQDRDDLTSQKMEHEDEDWLCITMEENDCSRQKMSRKKNYDDNTKEFKSKNLEVERRRREKLSRRLLMLRTIIVDAITYIEKLQDEVQNLSQQLHQMEATSEETTETKIDEIEAVEYMKNWGIQEDITVAQIDKNKFWVKIIIEKKRGGFSKLMETLNYFGIELMDTNLTTTKGAFLITSCMQGKNGERLEINQIKDLLQDIINDM